MARWARRGWPWVGPLAVAGVWLWVGLHFLGNHRYQINPDGIGYLSVAEKYVRGEFADAVNGYWSPLYSWLMAPLLAAGVESLLTAKVVGLLTSGAGLVGMWWLLRRAGCQRDVCTLACAAAAPGLVWAGYEVVTPDLLVACVLVFYLASFCHPDQGSRWPAAVRLGLLGGLAYLAKAYALPFVLGHFAVVRGVEVLRGGLPGRGRLLANSLVTLLAMGAVVGAWSGALTHKFGYFTTGSTGRYNLAINAPGSPGQIMHWAGLLPPPNATAISVWEDPTWHLERMPKWSPLATAEDRQYLWGKVKANVQATLVMLGQRTAWLYPLLLVGLLVPLSRSDARPRRPGFVMAAALVVYPLGYWVLHVEERFLTLMGVLLLALGAYGTARASRAGLLNGWWRRGIAMGVVGATFVGYPMKQLERQVKTGEPAMRLAEKLSEVIPAGAKVASVGNWGSSLYLSYFMDLRYYGQGARGQGRGEFAAALDEAGIEYVLNWQRRPRAPGEAWTEVAAEVEKPFRVYRRHAAAVSTTQATGDDGAASSGRGQQRGD